MMHGRLRVVTDPVPDAMAGHCLSHSSASVYRSSGSAGGEPDPIPRTAAGAGPGGGRRIAPATTPTGPSRRPAQPTPAGGAGRRREPDSFGVRARGTDRGAGRPEWLLLGLRRGDEAVALASLPAGAGRRRTPAMSASTRPPRSSPAGSSARMRQLTLLGVVHTHPGACGIRAGGLPRGCGLGCEPPEARKASSGSDGGRRPGGRREWGGVGWQPAPNVQCLGGCAFPGTLSVKVTGITTPCRSK